MQATGTVPGRTGTIADIMYDGFYSGAIGGSIVALFFLVFDTIEGHPFHTPSLLGTVLFGGVPVDQVAGERIDMMAYFTALHFLAFGIVGFGIAWLVREVELHARHPAVVLLITFVIFQGAFFTGAFVLIPDVIEAVGTGRIAYANLLAAAGMVAFLIAVHRPDLWARIRGASD